LNSRHLLNAGSTPSGSRRIVFPVISGRIKAVSGSGYDLGGFGIEGANSEIFTPLRLDPRAVHVFDGTGFPADFTPRTAQF
jgi:hypothetical protein